MRLGVVVLTEFADVGLQQLHRDCTEVSYAFHDPPFGAMKVPKGTVVLRDNGKAIDPH